MNKNELLVEKELYTDAATLAKDVAVQAPVKSRFRFLFSCVCAYSRGFHNLFLLRRRVNLDFVFFFASRSYISASFATREFPYYLALYLISYN